MSKVKFYYTNGKVTSRKPNKKEEELLKVYAEIIGSRNDKIEYRQEPNLEWTCEIEDNNYFIKGDDTFSNNLCSGPGSKSKSITFEYMVSEFKNDLNEYYKKFVSNYNYFK